MFLVALSPWKISSFLLSFLTDIYEVDSNSQMNSSQIEIGGIYYDYFTDFDKSTLGEMIPYQKIVHWIYHHFF